MKKTAFGVLVIVCLFIFAMTTPILVPEVQTSSAWPSNRNSMPIAYDSGSDRTILFGGWEWDFNTSLDDTWAYDCNENSWQNMNPTTAPSPRAGHAMAYDSGSDRTILFSGHMTGHSTTLENWNETWAYHYDTNTWTNMEPNNMPSPRLSGPMAYDSESDVLVLFGGLCDGGVFNNETWVYDFDANNWTNMEPFIAPSRRVSTLAYDSESDLVILFGGGGYEQWPVKIYTDTWVYDYNSNTWTEMSPADSPTSAGFMAYDEESDVCVFHGGCMDWFEEVVVSETWEYDYETNTWTEITTSPVPEARSRIGIAYDSESDCVVLYSGGQLVETQDGSGWDTYTYRIINDLWTFDANSDTWERMGPATYEIIVIVAVGGGVAIIALVLLVFLQRKREE